MDQTDGFTYLQPFKPILVFRNFDLRRRLDSYHVMVDKEEAADILLRSAPPQGKKWSAFLKIDCGNKRAGVWWSDHDRSVAIAKTLSDASDAVEFQGLYVHCGNSYSAGEGAGTIYGCVITY